jgi:sugar phosphate isomerase/epimerase
MLKLKTAIRLDCLRQPLKKALVTAAQLNADAVEINAWTQLRPADMSRTAVRHFRKLIADLNLTVAAVHFPTQVGYDIADDLDRRIDATKQAMTMAYELGCNVVVNHIGRVPEEVSGPRWSTLVQALTDLGNHGQRAGAWLAAKTATEDGATLKGLIDVLPVHSLGVDFDPAGLIINGHDPSEAIEHLGQQVMSFRARDAVTDLSAGRGVEVELGRGSVDWAKLLGVLEEHNYNGHLTVDRETSDNSVEQCGNAIEYLRQLFG